MIIIYLVILLHIVWCCLYVSNVDSVQLFKLICSIVEIVDRYKKEQIVEGHVLCTPVVKVSSLLID